MAGLYIHIPFCRQACRYCDFYFTVSLKFKKELIDCMILEIRNKKKDFEKFEFETIYFGGGTPSVLEIDDFKRLLDEINKHFRVKNNFEFSIEANPDDLSPSYLKSLKFIGVNRLSIGIQSFHDKDLKLMRRSHDANQALTSIRNAHDAGISNLNIDLIYGIPEMSLKEWKENLDVCFQQNIKHISAYHLTFEPGTVFDHWRKKNKIAPIGEEESLRQFKILIKKSEEEKFLHYEISNFSKEAFVSLHNTNYWKGVPYLGIGPSAHSYDGKSRFWNISSIKQYIEKTKSGSYNYTDKEELSLDDSYNEYVLTSLRTMWGIDLDEILKAYGDNYVKYTLDIFQQFFKRKLLNISGRKITISKKGIFLADQIIREFFRI